MRWEDERYVKLYTRETPDWIALSWQARALFRELMTKVDRAGILPMGKSRWRGVAGVVRMPIEVVEKAYVELLEDGCVTECDGVLLIPNFLTAQETHQSDRARQQKSREVARAKATVTIRDDKADDNTPRDDASQLVTGCHSRSQHVTLRVEETRVEETRVDKGEGEGAALPAPGPKPKSVSKNPKGTRIAKDWKPSAEALAWCAEKGVDGSAHVEEFIDHWAGVSGAKGLKLDWDGTYRNRIRDLIEWGRAKSLPPPAESKPEVVDDGPPIPMPPAMADRFDELFARLGKSSATGLDGPSEHADIRFTPKVAQ